MPEGVVIESLVGRYGKIISLKEIENKVWSNGNNESVDVTNDTDGAENMSMIKRLLDSEHKISGICKCSR